MVPFKISGLTWCNVSSLLPSAVGYSSDDLFRLVYRSNSWKHVHGCCTFCGTEGTSEEFNSFIFLLIVWRTLFILHVLENLFHFDISHAVRHLVNLIPHANLCGSSNVSIFLQDFWFGLWFIFVAFPSDTTGRAKSLVKETIDTFTVLV